MKTFAFAGRLEPDGQFVCEWLTEGFCCITGYTGAGCDIPMLGRISYIRKIGA
jgi:hypothetical protein